MLLYDTKYLQLKSTKSKSGNDWVYAHRPNAKDVVVILPLINNKQVLFLIEERPPLQAEGIAKYSIALPAGLVGDERIGETIEEAINAELMEEAGKGDIVVQMSMYSDNEQVGSLGKSYTKNDEQITTHSGDIVLYSGDKIVVFYGSNSWVYTRLGKMNIPEDDVTELLSNGDIILKIVIAK